MDPCKPSHIESTSVHVFLVVKTSPPQNKKVQTLTRTKKTANIYIYIYRNLEHAYVRTLPLNILIVLHLQNNWSKPDSKCKIILNNYKKLDTHKIYQTLLTVQLYKKN